MEVGVIETVTPQEYDETLEVIPLCEDIPLLTSRLAIYYKFDALDPISGGEFDGFLGSPDLFGVCDLNTGNSSGEPVLVNDGIIDGALHFPVDHINIGLNSFTPTSFTAEQKALFDVFEQSFTIRFWMRLLEPGTDDLFMDLNDLGPPGSQWRFEIDSPTNKARFTLFGQALLSNEAIPIDGQFHRVVVSRDFDGSLLTIKIDDNPTLSDLYTGTDASAALDYFFIGNTGFAFDMDELGIWKDYVWTEADETYDWNSGDGRTSP
jgi:hypothetical protein